MRNDAWKGFATCVGLALASAPCWAQESGESTTLFDGESLTGWVTTGGRYDGHASWSVEDGAIVGRQGPGGVGGLLYTQKKYAAFELEFETRIDYPFDSGVFLRMAPEGKGAQITLDYRPGGEVGAIYSDGFLQHNEAGTDRFKRDDWNHVRVRCTGFDMHIECWLNGDSLVDYRIPTGSRGYAPTGLIGLQVHGARDDEGAARFRNIRIRELPLFGDGIFAEDDRGVIALRAEPDATGAPAWRALFDGDGLEAWEVAGEADRYEVRDGVLAFRAAGGGGHLLTTEDFTDFRLRLDFKQSKMANSGVFLRAARDGSNPAYSGCEVQLLDDFHWEAVTGTTLEPWQFTGSLYGAVPPGDRAALRPLGSWNTYEILYQGTRLAVALNGSTLYDVDTTELEATPPFAERAATGFIGLQHHGAQNIDAETMIWFRNIWVQPILAPGR